MIGSVPDLHQPLYKDKVFVPLILLWVFSGFLLGNLAFAVVVLSALYLAQKRMYLELFLGFFFILIFSDSRQGMFDFAATAKEFYVLICTAVVFLDNQVRSDRQYVWAFIPFFVVAGICVFLGPVITSSFLKTLSYFLIILIVPNFVMYLYESYGDLFLKYLIELGGGVLAVGLALNFTVPDFVQIGGRFSGLLGNPNGIGVFLILFTALFKVIIQLKPNLFSKRERYIVYFLIFASLILCASRTALLCISLFFLLAYTMRISRVVTVVAIVVIILMGQYLLLNLPDLIRQFQLQEYARLETLESLSGRTVAYTFALEKIKDNFWLGQGFAYSEYLFKYYQYYLSQLGHQGGTHNTYLTIWLNTGVIGLAFFIFGWFSMFARASKKVLIAFPIGLVILVSTFFEAWLTASLNPFTITLLILLSVMLIPGITNTSGYQKTN